ncbi:MAG: hypothetical protein U9R42_09250 [Bacteroidota bacterium]|nr:hypothetical protein [Bacteroidota bacterium]
MKQNIDIQSAVHNLEIQLNKASSQFYEWTVRGQEKSIAPAWIIEACFLQLLCLSELLNLTEFHKMVYNEYTTIKESQYGFNSGDVDPDGDPYSTVIGRIRCFSRALINLFPEDKITTVRKDLLQIIRDIHYVITDSAVFQNPPNNENDVHLRIEAVLKCVFPDLKHKPVLTKQIKNFIPDTGIPSLQTLIEYKYLSKKADVGIIADQLLADTRGYTANDWSRYLYVIYETNRFRTESDWNLFLREAEVSQNTTIVVLGGEQPSKKK